MGRDNHYLPEKHALGRLGHREYAFKLVTLGIPSVKGRQGKELSGQNIEEVRPGGVEPWLENYDTQGRGNALGEEHLNR